MTALPATCAPPRAALAAPPAAAVLGMLLAALLLAAPLPLACAPAGPRAWLAAGVGAVAAAVALAGLLRGRGAPPPPAALPFGLFLLLIAAQLLPIAGPAAPEVLGDAVPTHLSLVPARTAARGIDLLAWFGCFAAAAALLASARRARRFLGCLLGLAAALAVYGLLAWQGALPLVDAQQPRTVLVATFVNRNHLAHLLGLGALVGLGLFAALRQRGAPPALLALTGAGIAAAVLGIVGTQSRGGFVALAVGICAFPLLAMRSRRRRRAGLAIGLTAAIAAVLWLLPAGLLQRFSAVGGELQAPGTRTDIWRGAIALWAQFPWTGTGLGTFGDLSPATQPAAVPGRVEHAHSDPLELLAETGAAGALLLAAAVLAFAVPMVRRCLGHRDRERALLAAGGLAALAATAVHALVEFHLQIPANAAWTAAVAGLVAGVLRSPRPAPARPWFGVALLAAGALAAAGGIWRAVGHTEADGLAAIDRGRALLAHDPHGALAEAERALRCNPFSPRAHRLAGEARLGDDPQAAAAAFARYLRWTNRAQRPQHALGVAVLCLGAGEVDQARTWLAGLLPGLPQPERRAALDQLAAAMPHAAVLLAAVPADAALHAELAEALLRRGDFAEREAVLARRRGDAQQALLTVADEVLLVRAEAPATTGPAGTRVDVRLGFARATDAAPAPLVLHVAGPGAAIYRSFAADADAYAYTANLDTTFPPGSYALSLDFRADAARYPFATVTIGATELDLGDGATVPATALYWTTAEPGRRLRPARGVPLRPGDALWRDVRLPAGPCDLVLRTELPARLTAEFDGATLVCAHPEATRVHRFPLPGATTGRLTIRAASGDAPLLSEFFVQPRTAR